MPIRFTNQKNKLTPLALAIGLAFPLISFAQQDDSLPQKNKVIKKNETITVVATGSQRDTFTAPMMVDVVENNSAESRTATSAVDMLKYIPGLVINGSGRTNGQDVSLRGYNSQGVLTLVDGVRQTNQAGHINGVFLDPTLIKRVEVVKGSSALLYGSGALGGVISYQTVDAKDLLNPGENGGFHVFSNAGTGDHSFGIGLSAFGRTDNLDGVFSFASRNRGKIKQSNGINAPNQEHINNLFGKGTWYIDDTQSLTGNLRYYHNDAHQPSNPQESLPNNDNPQGKRTTAQTDGQLEYHLKPTDQKWLDLTTRVYYSNLNIRSADNSSGYATRKQYNKGIKAENTTILFPQTWSIHTLKYGSEVYQEKQTPGGTSSFPSARTNFSSGWLQDEIALRDLPINFVLGTRYDNYRAKDNKNPNINAHKWSSRASMSITPTDWSMLFASYSQAFRAPTMNEMYNDGFHFSMGPRNVFWAANPNLKPETNATQEYGFGLRFDDLWQEADTLQFKSSYFNTKASNYIAVNSSEMFTKGIMYYENTPHVNLWGVDSNLSYKSDLLSWSLAYNHTQGKDQQGKWLQTLNPDMIINQINVPLPIADLPLSVGWSNTWAARNSHTNGEPQASYNINDFSINYQGDARAKGVTASLVLANAFNKSYLSPIGEPGEGRSLKLLLGYQW